MTDRIEILFRLFFQQESSSFFGELTTIGFLSHANKRTEILSITGETKIS